MGSSTRLSSIPHLNKTYKTDEEACIDISNQMFQWEYVGSGEIPSKHPLNEDLRIEQRQCLNCESQHLLVIYAQRSIHPMNGDEYYDLEVVCQDCGKFSIFAFSDND